MYIAPMKYPGSRSNLSPQTGHRSCMATGPRHTGSRKSLPCRHRGQSWRRIPWNAVILPAFICRISLRAHPDVFEHLDGGLQGVAAYGEPDGVHAGFQQVAAAEPTPAAATAYERH